MREDLADVFKLADNLNRRAALIRALPGIVTLTLDAGTVSGIATTLRATADLAVAKATELDNARAQVRAGKVLFVAIENAGFWELVWMWCVIRWTAPKKAKP